MRWLHNRLHRARLWLWRRAHPKQAAAARERISAMIVEAGGIGAMIAAHDGDLKSYDDWRLGQWRKAQTERGPKQEGSK